MRKISNQSERDRKDKRNKIILGIFLIIVMLFSVIGYSFMSGDEVSEKKLKYGGVEFVLDNAERWNFQIGGNWFNTRFNPEETKDIFVPVVSLQEYTNNPLYLSIESDWKNEIKQEIFLNLNSFLTRIQDACLDDTCSEDYPIKNCEEDKIIVVEVGEIVEIKGEGNCILITAPEEEMVKSIDAVLFKILGISKKQRGTTP